MDFVAKHWGDLASLLGVVLTIWFAWRAKTASEQARDAARAAAHHIFALDTAEDLSAALTIMQEILRLQRLEAWEIILDRCAALQLYLCRSEKAPNLPETSRVSLRTAAAQFAIIMDEIEAVRTDHQVHEFDSVKFNRVIVKQMSAMESAKMSLRGIGD